MMRRQEIDGRQAGVNLFSKIKTVAYYSICYLFYDDSKLLTGQPRGCPLGQKLQLTTTNYNLSTYYLFYAYSTLGGCLGDESK